MIGSTIGSTITAHSAAHHAQMVPLYSTEILADLVNDEHLEYDKHYGTNDDQYANIVLLKVAPIGSR